MTSPRNKPCPCLSGAKFKKCCGSQAVIAEKRAKEQAERVQRAREEERERLREAAVSRNRQFPALAVLAALAGSSYPFHRRSL